MRKMVGIYFSGTGNSKYAAELFCKEYDNESNAYSIEETEALTAITDTDLIIIAYPVQFSTVPKIMRDYITDHSELWMNKKVFIIATMGLFSGDGSGMLGRLLQCYGAKVIGGLHLKMPDSIADEKANEKTGKRVCRIDWKGRYGYISRHTWILHAYLVTGDEKSGVQDDWGFCEV